MSDQKVEKRSTRDGFGHGLLECARQDENVVALSADLTDSTRAGWFRKEFPERFFTMGVSEQDMIGTAAGLSLTGKIPFATTFAAFAAGRVWEQIRISVCYMNLNVKIAATHGGVTVGPDGATHQSIEEIALMRILPHMTLIVPCDYAEAKMATIAAAQWQGPVFLRFSRNNVPLITAEDETFEIGKAKIMREGTDVTIIACGQLVWESLQAVDILAQQGIHARLINMHTIKPIDREVLINAARETGVIVTAEEHTVLGGLGGAVSEVLAQECPVPVKMIGMKDVFGESGEPAELLERFELTTPFIVQAVKDILPLKKSVQ